MSKPINKTSTVKAVDGLGNNVRDYIYNPAENKFQHVDDLVHESPLPVGMARELKFGSAAHRRKYPSQYKTINELKDLKKYQDSANIHHPSYGTYKEHTVGTAAHRKKYPERYGYNYTSGLDRAAYPEPGTAPSEKIINDYGPVKYDKNGYPDKASPAQVGAMAEKFEEMRQMTGSDGRHDKPKSKKINAYADVKIPIPVIDHALLRQPKHDARDAALKKLREYAFKPADNSDANNGIGSFRNSIGKELRANNSKSDWEKRNKVKYI